MTRPAAAALLRWSANMLRWRTSALRAALRSTALNRYLDDAELALLADALDHSRDVRIRYRNKDGNRSVRDITPRELYGRWIDAWCHLRSGEREFTVAGIEAVSPVG